MLKTHLLVAYTLFLLVYSCTTTHTQPTQGYHITIDIKDATYSELYLGFYYKGKTYVTDTSSRRQKHDPYIFSGSELLDPGFYFLLDTAKTLLFEFVLGGDQHFSMKTEDIKQPIHSIVEGDIDNMLYFRMLRDNAENYEAAKPYIDIASDSTKSEQAIAEARQRLEELRDKLEKKREALVQEYPDQLVSTFIRASTEITIPRHIEKDPDSLLAWRYYRAHLFDSMPLHSSVVLRFPKDIVNEKLDLYLDKLHPQQADTLIQAIERLAQRANSNEEVLSYIIWLCTLKYQKAKIMGLDKVFVHLYDTYYETNRMTSIVNEQLKGKIKKIVSAIRLTLIGNEAPNLIMQDQDLKPKSLYEMPEKYRLIYFFDPDCHACSLETPKLVDFYNKTSLNIGIFAVCADTSIVKMKSYIEKMKLQDWTVVNGPRSYVGSYHELYDANSTPTLVIIDKRNMVIAKKIGAEQIENFLSNYEKIGN